MWFNNCNETQRLAVKHHKGPMLLAAGPGSGKTFTSIARIRYLIEYYQVPPSEILVITFTKAAAAEMEQRFKKAVKEKSYPVCFGTFHAIFFHVLKQTYHYNSNHIMTEKEKKEYATYALEGIRQELDEAYLEELLGEFGKVKNSVGGIEKYTYSGVLLEPEQFANVYKKYRDICAQNKKLDFDDMALLCLSLFQKRPDVLKIWQKRFSYLLVDEFQDINEVQYMIMKLLAGEQKNLFVVGDDDQSIYGFRGANPVIMRRFLGDFTDAKQVVLKHNYRSGKDIVELSMRIIKENKNRLPKEIVAATEKKGTVSFFSFDDREKEYKALLQHLKEYQKKGKLKECALIFRTNREVREMKNRLKRENIPFLGAEKGNSVYRHFIMRDIEDYIRFAEGDCSRARFLRIVNKPSRYISRDSVPEGEIVFQNIKDYYRENRERVEVLEQFEKDLAMLKNLPPFLAVNFIRKAMNYDGYLLEQSEKGKHYEGKRGGDELFKIAEEIQRDAAKYSSCKEWFTAVLAKENVAENNALGEMAKGGRGTERKDRFPGDVLTVTTMHGAKGLEYETVFLPDINEGTVPYGKLLTEVEVEEERRIFYVAVTRAKAELKLYYVENKQTKKSRFIDWK